MSLFQTINKGLIVSCQALEGEPLYGSLTMAKMANAAKQGGAVAIRANGISDIKAIKQTVDLPVIGLIKQIYRESEVYITPTKTEIDKLIDVEVDMIALDATDRARPRDEEFSDLVSYLKKKNQRIMADISTVEEDIFAEKIGVDCISTTLSGYTTLTKDNPSPDLPLVKALTSQLNIPIIAEGKITSPEQALKALNLGAHAVVVGGAITRPQFITERYVKIIGN